MDAGTLSSTAPEFRAFLLPVFRSVSRIAACGNMQEHREGRTLDLNAEDIWHFQHLSWRMELEVGTVEFSLVSSLMILALHVRCTSSAKSAAIPKVTQGGL